MTTCTRLDTRRFPLQIAPLPRLRRHSPCVTAMSLPVAPANDLEENDDHTLMAHYAGGNGQAARILTQRLLPKVYALSLRMLGTQAAAEDAAQDVMMKLWKMAPDWQADNAKVSTWLHRVTVNHCTDILRKRKPRVALDETQELVSNAKSVETVLMQGERAVALERAMEKLPERQKIAVHLRHIEECSNIEIAQIMDISVEAVESLVSRGKRALKAALLSQRDELGLS